ncbi:MAG: hypothetical protein ACTHNQ_05890 [Microbacterium sp.]|uniref:hypothetical protein n=1 Tax=Microbacterium sp. TaxID=51671 RepID=UPI00036B2F91
MDGITTVTLADRVHRERTAELVREHEARRNIADRGVQLTPETPIAHAYVGLGLWLHEHFARPRRPRFA